MYTSKHIFNLDYQRHAIWNAAFLQFRSSAIELRWVGGRSTTVGGKPGFQFYTNDHLAASTCWMMDEKSTTFWALCCLSLSLSVSLFQSVDIFVCVINCFCAWVYVCPLNKLIRIGIPRVSFWTQDPLIRFPKGCTIVLCVPNSCGLHIDRPRVVENRRWDWGKCARVKFV